jgi:hypothetical protein
MGKTKLARGAKTAFIRAHANLSAKEVVEAAAKEGIKLTTAAVYNTRSLANKSKGKQRKASTVHRVNGKGANGKVRSSAHGANGQHLMAAVEFCRVSGGLERARQALQALASLQLN